MKYRITYGIWAGLFALCAGLGFLPEGPADPWLTALSVVFFAPAVLILLWASREGERSHILLVRNLSAWSLVVTLVLLVANVVSAISSRWVGDVLHALLTVMAAPLVCSRIWALSMFLWACLLMTSLSLAKKRK